MRSSPGAAALIVVVLACLGRCQAAKAVSGVRTQFYDFVDNPFYVPEDQAVRFLEDGILVIGDDGKILDFGNYSTVSPKYPGLNITTYRDRVALPGFIDAHTHYVQAPVTGEYGEHTNEWLQTYVFPIELDSDSFEYASALADWYIKEMLKQGTTTFQTFTNTNINSTDAIFSEASKRNMRIIAGVTGEDRVQGTPSGEAPAGGAPANYADTAMGFYNDSLTMYYKWHGTGRNLYAVSPRFVLGDTEDLLTLTSDLVSTLPGVYFNTHINEQPPDNINALKLFTMLNASDALDIFGMNGLIGPRSTFGHAIWLSKEDYQRLAKAGANTAHNPASNLFLGAGLFPLAVATAPDVKCMVSLGSDIGGGNYFGMMDVLNDAYKVQMLNNYSLSAAKGLYMATKGGAEALSLQDKIGSFNVGNEADFVIWNPTAQSSLKLRNVNASMPTPADRANKMFGLMMLGDDRNVDTTYIMGKPLYVNPDMDKTEKTSSFSV